MARVSRHPSRSLPAVMTLIVVGVACFAASMAAPSTASANAISDVRYTLDGENARITIVSTEPLPEPRFRTERGALRMWFPEMSEDPWFSPSTDGHVISSIRMRPGSNDTAVLHVRLGDRRVVPREMVQIERAGEMLHVTIARAALPGGAPGATQPIAAEASTVATASAAAANAPASDEPSETITDTATATDDTTATDDEAAAPTAAEPHETHARREHGNTPAGSTFAADNGPGIGVLLMITVILGVFYLAMRVLFGKKKDGPLANIDVIAQKRLGPKSQLVVVRALGEDHLLSINGGQTQHLGSTPAPAVKDANATSALGSEPANGNGVLAFLKDRIAQNRTRATADDDAAPAGVAEKADGRRSRPGAGLGTLKQMPTPRREGEFGAELLKLAEEAERRQSRRPAASALTGLGSMRRAHGESEAVAGLLKLKHRAG